MPTPHVEAARKYAKDVKSGKVAACKWVRHACQRFERDVKAQRTKAFPYRLDDPTAERVCRFVELMPHIKGEWARRGDNLVLEPWQCFILVNVFGWVHKKTGLRRFRTAYIEVPRKNAKSTISSAVGLYMLAADNEAGAEVYSAATTRLQAKVVFQVAHAMARRNNAFRQKYGVHVGAQNVNVVRSSSKFEALSSEGNSLDGLNISCAVIDELHAHKTRLVFDVLETATGSRPQPLMWLITTAGSNRAGVCYEQRTYLTKVLEEVTDDDTYFGIIYTLDDGDDWMDPAIWAKANPNYGVSVYEDDISRLCRKAQEMPAAQSNFLTKRLNVWVNADSAWMDMRAWDRAADETLDREDFVGEPCLIGLDLATKVDIAARVDLFTREIEGETHYYAFGRYYLPQSAVDDGRNSQYSGWEIDNLLVLTQGDVIDFSYIQQELLDDAERFEVVQIAYDPWQATQLATKLMTEGANVVEIRPTVQNFSEPMKELDALVRAGRFHHNGDPVLAWMVSNVVCHIDAKDNIYPRKERPENKIDGVIALIMALAVAITHTQEKVTIPLVMGIGPSDLEEQDGPSE